MRSVPLGVGPATKIPSIRTGQLCVAFSRPLDRIVTWAVMLPCWMRSAVAELVGIRIVTVPSVAVGHAILGRGPVPAAEVLTISRATNS